ncbi:MAG: hypothetical protein KGH77_03270 [Candidatus Micrarchaeota archaeon]|nr:hypothetical protein [Candidatus Micrarchaeota archaeon]MDE1864421.1 hypothetical protein [Candidatus Micrarchaeota archaeon]
MITRSEKEEKEAKVKLQFEDARRKLINKLVPFSGKFKYPDIEFNSAAKIEGDDKFYIDYKFEKIVFNHILIDKELSEYVKKNPLTYFDSVKEPSMIQSEENYKMYRIREIMCDALAIYIMRPYDSISYLPNKVAQEIQAPQLLLGREITNGDSYVSLVIGAALVRSVRLLKAIVNGVPIENERFLLLDEGNHKPNGEYRLLSTFCYEYDPTKRFMQNVAAHLNGHARDRKEYFLETEHFGNILFSLAYMINMDGREVAKAPFEHSFFPEIAASITTDDIYELTDKSREHYEKSRDPSGLKELAHKAPDTSANSS